MKKLTINSSQEALDLEQKLDAEITHIEFAKFRVTDETILALNGFIKNNYQSLVVVDLRNVLELTFKQMAMIAETARENSASLEVVSVNLKHLHGKSAGVLSVLGDKKLKKQCETYQTFLSTNHDGFSKQNRMNFSTEMPQEFADLLDVFQRNFGIKNSEEFKKDVAIAEAMLPEKKALTGNQYLELFKEFNKESLAASSATESYFGFELDDEEFEPAKVEETQFDGEIINREEFEESETESELEKIDRKKVEGLESDPEEIDEKEVEELESDPEEIDGEEVKAELEKLTLATSQPAAAKASRSPSPTNATPLNNSATLGLGQEF